MVRTWSGIGQSSFPGRGALPGRTAMGGGIDVMSGFGDPNGIRRARLGSLYSDRDILAATTKLWININGGFQWCSYDNNCI